MAKRAPVEAGAAPTPPPANEEFDPAAADASLDLVERTIARYFRLQSLGTEHIPEGRCMVVGCHSGVIPYDAALTLLAIRNGTGRLGRAVGDHFFGTFRFVDDFLRRRGAIVGRREEATEILRQGNILLVFPGGTLDMTRPIWRDHYRVVPHRGFAPGHGGYVKIALETRSPIVPVAIVGAEEVHGFLWDAKPLARAFRVPFFPIVLSALPLPVRIYVRFGRPIRFRHGPEAAGRQEIVDRLNRQVRHELQDLIDDTLHRRRGLIWSRLDLPEGEREGEPGAPVGRATTSRRSR